MESLLQHKFST